MLSLVILIAGLRRDVCPEDTACWKFKVFVNILKTKAHRAQSYIRCIYKLAYSASFGVNMKSLRFSEADIYKFLHLRQSQISFLRISRKSKPVELKVVLSTYINMLIPHLLV